MGAHQIIRKYAEITAGSGGCGAVQSTLTSLPRSNAFQWGVVGAGAWIWASVPAIRVRFPEGRRVGFSAPHMWGGWRSLGTG